MIRGLLLALLFLSGAAQARTLATSDITVYVDPAGSDTTGDGTAAHPWATPQHAADGLYDDYDFRCRYKATIQLAVAPPGSYNFYSGLNISGRLVGQCGTMKPITVGGGRPAFVIGKYLPFTLQGDTTGTNPLGAFINPGREGRPAGACISMSDGAALKVVGIACDTSTAAQDGFDIFDGSYMDMSNVWFGNAGTPGASYSNHISVAFGSRLIITGDYGMSGTAQAHIQYASGSVVSYENNGIQGPTITVTITGSPAFPGGFYLGDAGAAMYVMNVHFTGPIIGPSAVLLTNATLESGSGSSGHVCAPSYFPGSIAPLIYDYAVCR